MMLTPNGRFELNTKVRLNCLVLYSALLILALDLYQLHQLYAFPF